MNKVENIINYITANESRIEWHNLCTIPYGTCELGILHETHLKDYEGYIIFLKSYRTIVAGFVLDHDYTYAFITGIYSATTRKHLSKFMSEFAPSIGYYGMKNIYQQYYGYKVITDNSVYLSILAQMQAYKKGNATWKNPTLN